MRFARASHERLELFFRFHLRDDALTLPRVEIHAGRLAGWLTRMLGIAAITLGRRVIVSPRALRRAAGGGLTMPVSLAVHEATHVLQYARQGFFPFLFLYLGEYVSGMVRAGELGARAHRRAYSAISFEVQAGEAETVYADWRRSGA